MPQSFTSERPHNVVTGSFARAGQQDWAVLCSRQDSSSVLIFWGGADAESPTEFPRAADAGYLQGIGEGRIGYSRLLAAASPRRSGSSQPRLMDRCPGHWTMMGWRMRSQGRLLWCRTSRTVVGSRWQGQTSLEQRVA